MERTIFTAKELYLVREGMYHEFLLSQHEWEIVYRNNPYNIELWEALKNCAEQYKRIVEKCNKAIDGIYAPKEL